MSLDEWLKATESSPPCGPDLEYDPEFLKLMQQATAKPEQQYGDTVIPAEEPDWRKVLELSSTLLARSKDLRVAALLARALTQVRGIPGLALALEFTRRLLEQHWQDVHPRLDVDGEDDPFPRANAVAALSDRAALLRDARASALMTPTGAQPITVRAAEMLLKGEAATAEGFTQAQLKEMARDATAANHAEIQALPLAAEHAEAINAIMVERLGPSDAPDLSALLELLSTACRLTARADAASPAATAEGAPVAGEAAATFDGSFRTRQDAIRALEAVCEYLQRAEPSNPAPLFIRRAQRLIGSNFLDIMNDVAPDSLQHIELLTGARHESKG
jgi:type VI secretion system protein ImpA